MKTTAQAFITLFFVSNSVLGFTEFDDGGLFLETQFVAQHDSNITGSSFKESDFIFSVNPTLEYRRESRSTTTASLGVNIVRFNDFDQFDSEDLQANFGFSLPVASGSPLTGGIDFGYNEATQVDDYINNRIATETTSFRTFGQYQVRQRVAVRGDLSYNDRIAAGFSDTTDKSAKIGAVITDVWQNVGLTVDYRARYLETSGEVAVARDDSDDAIFIGLTGQILPESVFKKLEAYASVSIQKIDSSRTGGGSQGSRDLIGYDAQISWEARPTTNVSMNFSKDLENTITDAPVENSDISLGITQQLSRLMTGTFSINKRKIGYLGSPQRDNRFGIRANMNYTLSRNWSAGLNLSYDDSDSNQFLYNYSRFTAGVFSVFRF